MNIKANELRLGNLIRFNNFIGDERNVIVNARFFASMAGGRPFTEVEGSNNSELNNCYSGIVLTPEIFEKCGFKKSKYDESYLFLNNDGSIVIETDGSIAVGDDPSKIGWASAAQVCSFLHQLQNLYFALTGQELEVKL